MELSQGTQPQGFIQARFSAPGQQPLGQRVLAALDRDIQSQLSLR